ncbi:hypothetical protein GCM10022222_23990 [Amycolatopsis ultiminotia]|uniref:FMN hydroxy acid dehydrogenase domain-containing protein n=1 Tax=Amycolatopsis ultiminotia TaxID=543629 RepID=A0ABP6VVR4_9PSEU
MRTIVEIEAAARKRLAPAHYDFYAGGADAEETLRANEEAFRRRVLVPRVLRGVSERDLSVQLAGSPLSMPVLVSPTAFHRLAHPEGEVATARAVARAGTVLVVSMGATTAIEDIAAAARAAWTENAAEEDAAARAAAKGEAAAREAAAGEAAVRIAADGEAARGEAAMRAAAKGEAAAREAAAGDGQAARGEAAAREAAAGDGQAAKGEAAARDAAAGGGTAGEAAAGGVTAGAVAVSEGVAAGAPALWFQLYPQPDRGFTEAVLRRVERAGVAALVVTVDSAVYGQRERDHRNGFHDLPPHLAVENMRDHTGRVRDIAMPAALSWADVEWLRAATTLPIFLKGILHPADARRAVRAGVSGLVVSNHGGRQLDSAISTVDALPAVASAVDGAIPLILDGGVRCGTDVVKALALGASAVGIGRPVLWGLAAAGSEGVTEVLERLRSEVDRALALCGAVNPAGLTADLVR